MYGHLWVRKSVSSRYTHVKVYMWPVFLCRFIIWASGPCRRCHILCFQFMQKWFIWKTVTGHEHCHGSTDRKKRVQATKNSDRVNRIVKKKTSHCLIDTRSRRNVVEKHRSAMPRTATFIICPGSAGWLMQARVYRELSLQREREHYVAVVL